MSDPFPASLPCPQTVEQLDDRISEPSARVVQSLEACPGDVLVLGAAGKMGFHVTRMLQRCLEHLGRHDSVIAVSRFSSEQSLASFEQFGIPTIRADLSDEGQLATLPAAPNVFFLAGVKFGTAHDPELLDRMNARMPRSVASRFRDSRIVALSTGCVYAFTAAVSGGSTEQSETDPPGEYAKSCLAREEAFLEGSLTHGTPCALVRLNYSVELRYGVLVDIALQVMRREPVNLETPYVNVIWQGDAVSQILQCLPCATSPPFVVNVTGAETLSVREIAEQFGERFQVTPSFRGEEAETCWLSNSTMARNKFGEPSVSVPRMMDWVAEWLQRGGPTLGKPTQFQVRDGNY